MHEQNHPTQTLTNENTLSESTSQTVDRQEARRSRVSDYQAASLNKEDPFEANIGSLNSGMMDIALRLEGIVGELFDSGARSTTVLQDIVPAIDMQLRVARQVERYSQLELRIGADRESARDVMASRQSLAIGGLKSEESEN